MTIRSDVMTRRTEDRTYNTRRVTKCETFNNRFVTHRDRYLFLRLPLDLPHQVNSCAHAHGSGVRCAAGVLIQWLMSVHSRPAGRASIAQHITEITELLAPPRHTRTSLVARRVKPGNVRDSGPRQGTRPTLLEYL